MMNWNQRKKQLKYFLFSLFIILAFQNCSGEGFRAINSLSSSNLSNSDSPGSNTQPSTQPPVAAPVIIAKTQVTQFTNPSLSSFAFDVRSSIEIKSVNCQLDSSEIVDCKSLMFSFPTLADGPHTITVDAEDIKGQKAAEFKVSTLVDTTKPEIKVISSPLVTTRDLTANIIFSVTDSGSGLDSSKCSIDANPLAACDSTLTAASLAPGIHKAIIVAQDKAGNQNQVVVNWEIQAGPKKVFLTYQYLCAISADDDLKCVPNDKIGIEAPQTMNIGKVKEADGCYFSIGAIQTNGNLATWDSRVNTAQDPFAPNAFTISPLPADLMADRLTGLGYAAFNISGPTKSFLGTWGSTTSQLFLPRDFRVIDSSCILFTNHPVGLRSDGVAVYLDFSQNGSIQTVPINENIIALSSSSSGGPLANYFLTANGNIFGQDVPSPIPNPEPIPSTPIDNYGKLSGAKDMATDSTGFACLIGGDNQVSCGNLVKAQQVSLAKPTDLGPVRQLSGSWNHFCAITTDGLIKCWDKTNMTTKTISGF